MEENWASRLYGANPPEWPHTTVAPAILKVHNDLTSYTADSNLMDGGQRRSDLEIDPSITEKATQKQSKRAQEIRRVQSRWKRRYRSRREEPTPPPTTRPRQNIGVQRGRPRNSVTDITASSTQTNLGQGQEAPSTSRAIYHASPLLRKRADSGIVVDGLDFISCVFGNRGSVLRLIRDVVKM